MEKFIAHYDHKNERTPHYLHEHVEEMLTYLKQFSLPEPVYQLAKISIILHDLGKKTLQFQSYVQDPKGKKGKVKHSVGGAYALYQNTERLSSVGQMLAKFVQLIVAGHHTKLKGCADRIENLYTKFPKELQNIEELSKKEVDEVVKLFESFPSEEIENLFRATDDIESRFIYLATFTRLAMSVMVDTDWLSTEKYFSEKLAEKRAYEAPSFSAFDHSLQDYYANKKFPDSTEQLNKLKVTFQQQAAKMGKHHHSFYTLHAPTGAGKTIAAIKFAIAHAKEHKKRRIITVLPLMNLTEEMSTIYQEIFGEEHVVEDHSDALVDPEEEKTSIQLAVNNWDRPFIVTTTNQLMESLFHNRPMKLRKLHRLYGSVIIIDEYHKLPFHVLRPILKQLDILQTYFNVTVIMMSATPFSIVESKTIQKMKLKHSPIEIVDWQTMFHQMPKRVTYEWLPEKQTMQNLARKIAQESTVLTIVNTRREAQKLFLNLKKTNHSFENVYHLSTTMCSEHRKLTLEKIQQDLKNQKRIAVISTSVLEAGIDVSFPVVFRMLAPLDAIIQAAGRCNRYAAPHGKVKQGRIVIFELQNPAKVEVSYQRAIETTRTTIKDDSSLELGGIEQFNLYFKKILSSETSGLDKYNITGDNWIKFDEVASNFQMIEDMRIGVICDAYEGFQQTWLYEKPTRAWWKKMQPYLVSLSKPEVEKKSQIKKEVRILKAPYDEELGVIL